jgi:hypothetical protein
MEPHTQVIPTFCPVFDIKAPSNTILSIKGLQRIKRAAFQPLNGQFLQIGGKEEN